MGGIEDPRALIRHIRGGDVSDAKRSAYTQTYSTADKTHAAFTGTDVTTANLVDDGGAYNAAWCDTVVTMCNELKTDLNALRADVADLKQLVNSVIDDLQALELVG